MPSMVGQRPKKSPSAHQKQMRFFTILSVVLALMASSALGLILWLLNRPKI
jgi:hypothetical protein